MLNYIVAMYHTQRVHVTKLASDSYRQSEKKDIY